MHSTDPAVVARRSLTVAAIGTLLTLVAFTAPLATINPTALTLFGAIARPLSHIESRSESLCVCHAGSLEGREGRTPRPPSSR